MKLLFVLALTAACCMAGWFFIPGAYWTFQDGTVGFLYAQGEHGTTGWHADARYSIAGDYWLDLEFRAKLIGERTSLRFEMARDTLENDWRRPRGDTLSVGYIANELSAYIRQNFNAGGSNKFALYAGIKSGKYDSPMSYSIIGGNFDPTPETRTANIIDMGGEFSIDSRDDPDNPQTAYYLKVRLGGLLFQSDENTKFDYLSPEQLSNPDKEWPPAGTGYIELDQRFYGKLQTKQVPFPLILAMRIALGHNLGEVPQIAAFRGGEDDFMRGVEKRRIMGQSYYNMSGELRAQVWEESYTPWILLHWIIPGYANPRPILEIAPFLEFAKVYSDYLPEKDAEQQTTMGLGLRWVFTDYTVVRYDFAYWPNGKTFGAYFSFEPGI